MYEKILPYLRNIAQLLLFIGDTIYKVCNAVEEALANARKNVNYA